MISLVVSGISSLNALRIFASVAVSTALVLSSRIRIFGFFFSYDGAERNYALYDVSLEIPESRVTAIVGESGSGKTIPASWNSADFGSVVFQTVSAMAPVE